MGMTVVTNDDSTRTLLLSGKAAKKMKAIAGLDGQEGFSKIEADIAARFLTEIQDKKVGVKDFIKMIMTDYNQALEAAQEKYKEVKSTLKAGGKALTPKFDVSG